MSTREYGTGDSDGLTPLRPLDLSRCESTSDLLSQLQHTAFGGRSLGEAADTLESMIRDPECYVVMTLSGAMTIAKMGLVICDMIERGWVQGIVSTGALMAHGLVEGIGHQHYKYDPKMNDEELYEKGYDRVYDTLELEKNLDDTEFYIRNFLDTLPTDQSIHSELIFKHLGKHLNQTLDSNVRAILKSAYLHDVPLWVPAFTDSELGLDFALLNHLRETQGKKRRVFDPFLDLESYAKQVAPQKTNGIFTIGGGVPRNWAQQLGPMLDIMGKRLGKGPGAHAFRFKYAVRVCPEPVHWGGLSGCTYSEGVSWGKFVPKSEGGKFSEVYSDATIAWPILAKALMERLGDKKVEKRLVTPEQTKSPLPA